MNESVTEKQPDLRLEEIKSRLSGREVPLEYKPWIEKVSFISRDVPFSMFLAEEYKTDDKDIDHLGDFSKDHAAAEQRLLRAEKSEFGKEMENVIKGRVVIDLGCGEYNAVRTVAEACSARQYIGVDKYCNSEKVGKNRDFSSVYIKDDMLAFLSKIDHLDGVVFHLSGLQPSETNEGTKEQSGDEKFLNDRITEENKNYIRACLMEMSRLCRPGDAILIAVSAIGFFPEKFGFKPSVKSRRGIYTIFIKE